MKARWKEAETLTRYWEAAWTCVIRPDTAVSMKKYRRTAESCRSSLPEMPPKPGHFPARNRIISGLADLVLVVEARERSGSLITADLALEQGKDVFAVPGRLDDELSRGLPESAEAGGRPGGPAGRRYWNVSEYALN